MSRWKIAVLLVTLCASADARQRVSGYCQKGGVVAEVGYSGFQITQKIQQSFPSCTVTVYSTGTTTLATIYADNSGTAKGNPFTADTAGLWFFYANNGRYDVRFSGGGIATPFTVADWTAADPLGIQIGTTVSAASTITATGQIFHVSGTAAISTISRPSGMTTGWIAIIADAAFTWTASGNIAAAGAATANKVVFFIYDMDTAKWYASQ